MAESYLERDTWSQLDMEPFELRALAAMLARTEPTTEAEKVIRQRVLDAEHRRQHRPVTLPSDGYDLFEHLRDMHGTIVYKGSDYVIEHVEQHQRAEIHGSPDPDGEFWTPHTHPGWNPLEERP